MGTDMRAHLEYRNVGSDWWVSLSSWDLTRDYDMYRLLANVRGQGALYSPRGVPRDAGGDARRAYLMPVAEDDEQLRLLLTRNPLAVSRDEAAGDVARGASEWWPGSGRVHFVSNPDYRGASWLTTAEFRYVVDYYVAHILEWKMAQHVSWLDSRRDELGELEYQRQLATPNWDTSIPAEQWLSPEFDLLLAAMETGEARDLQMRLIFWFIG